jgi:hypothetical protein
LGLDRASATLNLRFEITAHSCEIPNIWTTHLEIFSTTEYDREYTSIFDRLPLGKVPPPNNKKGHFSYLTGRTWPRKSM